MTCTSGHNLDRSSAHFIAAPAYTTVTARRSFVQPEPVKQTSPSRNGTQKIDWPQTVRDYVQRCFGIENHIEGVEREEIEMRLKRLLSEAAEANRLYSIDWTSHPTPQQLIVRERLAASSSPFRGKDYGEQSDLSKKRKPVDQHDDSTLPPWRKTRKSNDLESRVTLTDKSQPEKMEKKQKKKFDDNLPGKGTSKFEADLERRRQRFGMDNGGKGLSSPKPSRGYQMDNGSTPDTDDGPVIGTSQTLEKNYFRLTAPPKPETVRPLHVLEKSLEHVKDKWRKEQNYTYVCDQFKSIRQDLTVQHIKNEFTVKVYEIHARIALERGDLGEYNQCQTQLRALYSQKLGGHPAEFLAYRILYFIHTCNRTGMNDVLADLTPADKEKPAVKHALDVRSSLALGNYHRFFQLYHVTPNMGAYLMDMFIVRERLAALTNVCKA